MKPKNKWRSLVAAGSIVVLLFSSMTSCDREAVQSLPERNWTMVWSDEFDGNSGASPDAKKWSFDIGTGTDGWGNQELQYYTKRPENVALDGMGNLVITAKQEAYAGSNFTSARIKTENLFAQKYGRFEARMKTPFGPGIWPAFWMLGDNVKTAGWPNCGEIDIMELRGQKPNIIQGTLHGPGYSGGNAITKAFGLQNGRFDADYHIFAVEWTQTQIDFFVDGYLYQRITQNDVKGQWVYDHPFFLILNVAVGGNYVGFPNAQTPFPQKMIVDYVRVYQ